MSSKGEEEEPLSLDPIEHMQSADQSECGWVKRKGSSAPNKMVSIHSKTPPSPSLSFTVYQLGKCDDARRVDGDGDGEKAGGTF